MLFTLCADFSVSEVQAASAYKETQVKITNDGQVVDSFQGIDARYVTYSSYTGEYSCAGYVSEFYSQIFGVTVYNINMTDDKPTVYLYGHTAELKAVSTPIPGDIMQTKEYDHVAIVKDVSGSEVTLIEQNYKWNDWLTGDLVTVINRKCTADEYYYYRLYIDGKVQTLDNSGPAVSGAKASSITGEGFKVTAKITDPSGVDYVNVGTYLKSQGRASAKWKRLSKPASTISCSIKTADYGSVDGTYVTIINAYDKLGNRTTKTLSTYVDTTPPKISNVKISGVTAKGYTVTCTVSDSSEIKSVKFPSWTSNNSADDLDKNWAASDSSDGTLSGTAARFYVKTADHNNEKGEYITSIYAYDTYGNFSTKTVMTTISPATGITLSAENITIEKKGSANIKYTLKGSNVTDKVTWTTSDSSTASVTEGKVTGKNIGTATITAKTSAGKSAKCSVKITAPISDMKFSAISDHYYTGKAIKPAITVTNGTQKLVEGTDYTVSYSSNTSVGTAQVTVKGKGYYTGVKKLTFKICPAAIKGEKAAAAGPKTIKLSWNKYSGATGYYVYRYDLAKGDWVLAADVKTNSCKVENLTSSKSYSFRVKAYVVKDGVKYTGKSCATFRAATNPLQSTVSLSKSSGKILVKWNAQTRANGYQIYISKTGVTGTFKLVKTVNSPTTAKALISGTSGANYIKVRAYKTVDGKRQYGSFSSAQKITL